MARDERGRREETHQRVVKTRWWSFGPGTSKGGGRRPGTSKGGGKRWSFGPGRAREEGGDPPTSRNGSLVVVRAGIEAGSGRGPSNESH